jgi:hypothetical protein
MFTVVMMMMMMKLRSGINLQRVLNQKGTKQGMGAFV